MRLSNYRSGVCSLTLIAALLVFTLDVGDAAGPPTTNVNVVNSPTVNLAPGSSVGITGTPTVQVVNGAASPVPIRDSDNPARQRWQGAAQVLFNSPDTQLVTTFGPAIPAGKIFVIEYITAHGALPSGQKLRFILFNDAGYTLVQHYFAPTFVGTDFTVDNLILSESVRFYAISMPTINVTRFPDNSGSGFVNLSLSGYLVDQ